MMSLRLLRELRCLPLKRRRVVVVLFFECDFWGLFFLSLTFFFFSFLLHLRRSFSKFFFGLLTIYISSMTTWPRQLDIPFEVFIFIFDIPRSLHQIKETHPPSILPSVKTTQPIRHTNCAKKMEKSDQIRFSIITPSPLPAQERRKEQKRQQLIRHEKRKSTNMARCYIQLRRKNINRGGNKKEEEEQETSTRTTISRTNSNSNVRWKSDMSFGERSSSPFLSFYSMQKTRQRPASMRGRRRKRHGFT